MDLYTVTSLLTMYSLGTTAKRLKVEPKEILDFLEYNGFTFHNGEVVPAMDSIQEVAATTELMPPKVEDVRRRTLGMDSNTMNNWDKFTKAHEQYNIYELVTLALNEFMNKYE